MKKVYESPEYEIDIFSIKNSVMTASDGLDNGDTDLPIEGDF